MSGLHIPLGTSNPTRRHKRRVVWLLLGMMIIIWLLWTTAVMWFTRPTSLSAATEDTTMAFHFQPSRKTWPIFLELLENIPLISKRGLTIKDIQPFTKGEFAIFIEKDGDYALAVRSKTSLLPQDMLDVNNIVVKEVSSNIFLLSNKIMPLKEIHIEKPWFNYLPLSLFGQKILGNIYFSEKFPTGTIVYGKKKLTILFKKENLSKLAWTSLPEDTMTAFPISTNESDNTKNLTTPFIKEVFKSSEPFLSSLKQKGGFFILNKDGGYLVSTRSPFANYEEKTKFLKILGALQSPKTDLLDIAAGSNIKEITIDPGLVTIEETAVSGISVMHTKTDLGSLFIVDKNEQTALSNNENMIKFWLNPEKNTQQYSHCPGNVAIFDISTINNLSKKNIYKRGSDLLSLIVNKFPYASINNQIFLTAIEFCTD